MNCTECKEKLVAYTEGLLTGPQKASVETHLKDCPLCRAELKNLTELQKRLTSNSRTWQQTSLENAVLGRIVRQQNEKLKKADSINRQLQIWRKIMNSKITKLTAAAVIIIAVTLSITIFDKTTPAVYANEVLEEAVKAVQDFNSIHIKAKMRTLPQDNLASIGLDYDFVTVEVWKRTDKTGLVQWRVEKPQRIVVMDGNSTILLVRRQWAYKSDRADPAFRSFDSYWLGNLTDVESLLDSELRKAQKQKDAELLIRHEDVNGKDTLVLEVDVLARGDYTTNDYLKNKFISESDRTQIYYFDAKTKLLTGFKIVVHTDDKDVLVFEITDINYNPDIDDSVFALDLPENVIFWKEAEILPDNEKYEKMTPKEAAETFFQACADENWEEYLKFSPASDVSQQTKDYLGGLEIISIGKPFRSGRYGGWFVPYEIKLKSGRIKKHNLALRKDNPAKRFVVDGGI